MRKNIDKPQGTQDQQHNTFQNNEKCLESCSPESLEDKDLDPENKREIKSRTQRIPFF